jgi:large subunit ribosomal protein L22
MSVTVKLKYLRHSARKLQPVARLMLGKNLHDALNATTVMPQHAAMQINKALRMAEAAAKQKEYDLGKLVIEQIFAVPGPKIRRTRPNARGRANRYIKHLAHLCVTVGELKAKDEQSTAPAKKSTKARTKEKKD